MKKRKNNPKFFVKTAGIEPSKRKDFESSNVIITEKKDKRAAQFQVKDLPYPYTSVEQYEARFRTPVGSEWNSRAVHQKETMPRVTKKVSPVPYYKVGTIADEVAAGSYYRTDPKAVLNFTPSPMFLAQILDIRYQTSLLACCCTVSIMHTYIPNPISRWIERVSQDIPSIQWRVEKGFLRVKVRSKLPFVLDLGVSSFA